MLYFPKWKTVLVLAVCLLFTLFALPNFISEEVRDDLPDWFPSRSLNLGLDLQGGSHLLLQVDFEYYHREQLQNLADSVRAALREAKYRYRKIKLQGDSVVFQSNAEYSNLLDLINKIDPMLEFVQLDDNRYKVTYSAKQLADLKQKLLEQSIQIVNRRVNETGTREPIIQRQGEDRILVQVPGLQDPERLKKLLGKTAKMSFHLVDVTVSPQDIMMGRVPPGTRIMLADDHGNSIEKGGLPQRYAIKGRSVLSGDLLTGATATYERGQPVVAFKFNSLGARKFAEITRKNVGKPFAIVLDNKVITAPRINEPILNGSGIISGNFTVQSANDLALLLRAGALPAPLKIIEERTVGPSLGADSIAAGEKAALLGIVLIMLFMFIVYGRFGFYANVALILNMIIIIGALSLFQATLTLPGIAGIVLTFGMAVDANVLIFERIKEEIRVGKSTKAAIEHGFRSAFSTIMDANITTLIAAALLFYFGTGTIKGFAVTLSIGIVSSMFSAILITRMQVYRWVNKARPKTVPI